MPETSSDPSRPPSPAQILAGLVEDSPAVFIRWRLEPGLPVEFVSENVRQFGYTARELMSGAVSLGSLLDEDSYAKAEQDQRLPGQNGYRRLEYRLRTPDGKRRLVRFLVRTVREQHGRVCCQGVMAETMDSLEYEEKLRLLELAINTAQNGIIIADASVRDHPVIFVNRAVEATTGYRPDEVLGRNCRFLQGPEHDQPGLDVVREALRSEKGCEVELRNFRKDGTPFWNEVRISPVRDPGGRVTHFIGVQSDVTARKNAEAMLARRDAILEAVSLATETLLRSSDYIEALPSALRQIGEVTGADHLCVWHVRQTRSGPTLNLQHAWSGGQAAPHRAETLQDIPWGGPLGWPTAVQLQQGKIVQGSLDTCSPRERELVAAMGVRSYVALPIFDGPNHFWGVLSLGWISSQVVWGATENEAMLSATRILGAIIHNHDTERALRASEQRFRTLSSVSPVGIYEADATGEVIYVNRRMQEIFGLAAGELLHGRWRDLIAPGELSGITRQWEEAIRNESSFQANFMIRQPNGGTRWVKLAATPMHNPQGKLVGFVGTVDDITEYQLTNQALRQSEAQYRSLVINLKEVVFQTDAAGLWTYLNPAWEEVTGFSVQESLGRLFLDYVHPDDRERNNKLFQPLIQRQKEYCRHQVRYLAKDGGFRWVEVYARLTLDAAGQIVGTSGTLTDVTARREAEDTMRRQVIAIEAAVDGVALLTPEGVFSYLNSAHVSLFGYSSPSDLVGKSWLDLYAPHHAAAMKAKVDPELERHGAWRGTTRVCRRDGSPFDLELSLTMVDGGGIVCVCRDITDRLRAEERVQRSLNEKEVMLKEIHHRVKNNMQIVSSLLNLQLEYISDEATRTMFLDSQNRIASMALVHEKLYQSADLARIALRDYVHDLTESVVGSQGAHTAGIQFDVEAEDILVGIDTAIPCGLIINELVSNAYKHAFAEGATGRISLTFARTSPGWLRLEVADTGRGLPQNFDLRRARSLGMQLVALLVQQLRGTLEMKSDPGARFILKLQEAPQKALVV